MNTRTILHTVPITLATLGLVITSPIALAATNVTSAAGSSETAVSTTSANRLASIQTKGAADITARTTSLTSLIAKVNAAKKLTSIQKASLTTEMSGEVTSLGILKAKLAADTTVATAATDFQNIFKEHYIYAFFLPRTERIVAADDIGDAASQLTALAAKLQTLITTAKDKGTDTTALITQLADMQAKATAASTGASAAIASLVPLTAAGYPGNKTTVTAAAATIKTARTSLETARTDAKALIAALKKDLGSK